MKMWMSFIMAVLLSFAINGCDANNKAVVSNQADINHRESANKRAENQAGLNEKQPIKSVFSMASLPLIQNTVVSLSPTFSGKRHDIIMAQVCALAEGVKTQDEFIQFFLNKGINLDKLAAQDPGFALLADKDLAKKKTACMAYNVSSAFIPLNVKTLTIDRSQHNQDNDSLSANNLDEIKLSQQLNGRLQVMLTNAQFFAIIAENIEHHPAASLADYQEHIISIASELAPVYLKLLQQNAASNGPYTVLKMKDDNLVFSSANGYLYALEGQNVMLRLLDINWYAEGELLGQRHFIKVAP